MAKLLKLAKLYNMMLFSNLIMITLIIILYPVSFSLLMDPASWLGKIGAGITSAYGKTFFLFATTMLINVLLWQLIIILLAKTTAWKKPLIQIASRLVFAGFILMIFPCDRFDAVHSTGGGLVAVGLWLLSTILLIRSKQALAPYLYLGLHFFLQSSVLFCGYHFTINSTLKGFGQRPLILAFIIIPNICFYASLLSQNKCKVKPEENKLPGYPKACVKATNDDTINDG